ncbi:MAG: hypothetical protein IPN86_17815 [Saprospiraceae bacterium]|nr:hypothetical protein [Saprospiraceae bacterium]
MIRINSPVGVLWRIDGIDVTNPNHFATIGTTGGERRCLKYQSIKEVLIFEVCFSFGIW